MLPFEKREYAVVHVDCCDYEVVSHNDFALSFSVVTINISNMNLGNKIIP